MFEIIFLIAISFYFIQLILFTIGASREFTKVEENDLPSISVIVAARNEENNILDCLKSLDKLEYPEGKIEIIIVDDYSTDNTESIISDFISGKSKYKSIIPEKQIGALKGKTNALANAVKIAEGDVILTTDADCVVSPLWAKAHGSYYVKGVGFVGGYTTQQDQNAFGGMQAVDFIYLLTVAAGALNLGKPLSCIGNNMSYLKSAYNEIGGYENLEFSVTEDSNLLKALHKLKKYKILYPLDLNALVTSKPCLDWKSLYRQKKRWGVGGMKSDIIGYLVLIIGFITHLGMLLIPFFFSLTVLYLFLFKIFIDYFFIYPVFAKLKLGLKPAHFIAFEIYFILYVILLPFMVLPSRKVKWKERVY